MVKGSGLIVSEGKFVETIKETFIQNYNQSGTKTLIAILNCALHGMLGPIDKAIQVEVDSYTYKKKRELFDKLSDGNILITPELIKNNDFLHSYFATVNAALRMRSQEKISLLAQAFVTFSEKDPTQYADEYEELINILVDLSDIEIVILRILEKNENMLPKYKTSSPKDKYMMAKGFWIKFENEFSHVVSREDITARLARLQRTGLYESFSNGYTTDGGGAFSGAATTDDDPKGFLTSLYYKLKEYVLK